MYRYKLTIAYDGTSYAGWQIQPRKKTIQGELEAALKRFTGEGIKVYGSGRTDQGVHAAGQVAHVDFTKRITPNEFCRVMNALLSPDIRVLKAVRVSQSFHARKSAAEKEYRYFVWNDDILPPFIRYYRTHVKKSLDTEAMETAASFLVGRKDFAAFTANPKYERETTVRNLFSLRVKRTGHDIVIIARGDGFLYKMVRSIAGFLIRVGEGSVSHEPVRGILRTKKRTSLVPTAPPEGLFLWRVKFGN